MNDTFEEWAEQHLTGSRALAKKIWQAAEAATARKCVDVVSNVSGDSEDDYWSGTIQSAIDKIEAAFPDAFK